ncbi:MAG: hypothetical protein D3903_08370, partial [Candidatus Electrothrix sp. GM3_4]|nr:hypothetical protein [Candidatus Electrothrix sp. GM3_4]
QPYKMVVTNFLAWCIGHLDVRLHSQMYLWTGFAWGTAAACCLFFTGLIRADPQSNRHLAWPPPDRPVRDESYFLL